MGFLLIPHDFSFHSSEITTRHNRLIFIIFFVVVFTLPTYGAASAASVGQPEQQDFELPSSLLCETKTLDDVPPDPVSKFI